MRSIMNRFPAALIALAVALGALACGTLRLSVPATPEPTMTPTPFAPGWHRETLGGGGGQTAIAIDPTNSTIVYVTTDNGGIVKSVDGGETWFSINNNIGNGQLGDIAIDPLNPQVVYVTAQVYADQPDWSNNPVTGELYRTRNGGQSWEVVYAEGMGTRDGRCFGVVQWPSTRNILIPYDPANPRRYDADGGHLTDVIYVGGWDENKVSTDKRAGIWKSLDEGATFTQMALSDKNIWALRQDPDNSEVLYAGTYGNGLFVSRDGGATWESWRDRIPLPTISDIAIVPHSQTLYVSTNTFYSDYSGDEYRDRRGIYKSTDDGVSFFPVNSGLETTSLNFETLILDSTDPSGQTLYTGPWAGDNRGIYKTTDGGAYWTPTGHETSTDPDWFQDFDNLWAIGQASDGTLFAASWRGVYRYDPAHKSWVIKVNGLGNIAIRAIAFEPGSDTTIYLGLLDSTPWKSIDRGITWINIGQGFTTADGAKSAGASDFAISATDPYVVYATGIGSSGRYVSVVNKSMDGGAHWMPVIRGLPPTSTADPQWQADAIVVSQHDPQTAYTILELKSGGGRIYKTTDGGNQWREIYGISERPTDLAISSTDPETIVCVTAQGIVYVGHQEDSRWQSSSPEQGHIYAVDVFATDPNRILIGMASGAYLTTDGGKSWQHVFDKDNLQPFIGAMALSDFARARYEPKMRAVKFDRDNPNTLYLGHNPSTWVGVGVLKSVDGGHSWIALADEQFQMRSVWHFDLDPGHHSLVVGTFEIYYYRDAGSK